MGQKSKLLESGGSQTVIREAIRRGAAQTGGIIAQRRDRDVGRAVRAADSRIVWQTPLARTLLNTYFANPETVAPEELLAWIAAARRARGEGREPASLLISEGNKRLLASFHDRTGDDEWLVVLREENDASAVESLISAFRLTQREAEVLYWVVRGKTSKDIGDILGSSPRTVDKHLEHVFEKLGVETRTAAANLAMGRMRGN